METPLFHGAGGGTFVYPRRYKFRGRPGGGAGSVSLQGDASSPRQVRRGVFWGGGKKAGEERGGIGDVYIFV